MDEDNINQVPDGILEDPEKIKEALRDSRTQSQINQGHIHPNVTIRELGGNVPPRTVGPLDRRPESRHSVRPTAEDFQFGNNNPGLEQWSDYEMQPMKPAALLHTVQKWQLHYSGARGEDVENYITRIEEGRELLVFRDTDLIRVLPFTLRDAALTW